jgi:exopolyphosphatase/guanosine-5'-triphosphate,3'-diphosphate pyrophosphatase
MGGEMRFLGRQLTEKIEGNFVVINDEDFLEFIKSVSKMSAEEIVSQYGLLYEEAEILYPTLLIYASFLGETKTENIIVPMISIRDGLLLEISQLLSGYKRTDLSRQVTNSARSLGKKYKYDEPHASCVTSIALKLFDLLKEDHGLGSRERMLLETGGILHDIGMYISSASHHKHGAYLVDAAEIFGLRKADKDIISNIVRYHRRSTPKVTHVPYMSLPRIDRAIVSKLAAILRVADALDRTHQQKIREFALEKQTDVYVLWVSEEVGDISIERQGLAEKGDMFADVFGASIVLKQGNPPK